MLENNKPLVNQIARFNSCTHAQAVARRAAAKNKASTKSVDNIVHNCCLNAAHADCASTLNRLHINWAGDIQPLTAPLILGRAADY
jgi:hypothetical protein